MFTKIKFAIIAFLIVISSSIFEGGNIFSSKKVSRSDDVESIFISNFTDSLNKKIVREKCLENKLYELEEKFYRNRIPAEYIDAFLYYTKNRKDLRMHFYSIMVYESVNFKYFVNHNPNGTHDYGPSQLNSNNINNADFMLKYSPNEAKYITSRYCLYMVISFNLYTDLVDSHGINNAFYTYNGGEKAIRILNTNLRYYKKYKRYVELITKYNSSVNKIVKSNFNSCYAEIKDDLLDYCVIGNYNSDDTLFLTNYCLNSELYVDLKNLNGPIDNII